MTVDETVKATAIALFHADEESAPVRMNKPWEFLRDYQQERYLQAARAAILAYEAAKPVSASGGVEAVARVIYEGMGYDYGGRTHMADGRPFGAWALAVKCAERVAALASSTPAATEVKGERADG